MKSSTSRRRLLVLAVVTAVGLGLSTGLPADARSEAATAASHGVLPTTANGVWAYDEAGPGTWSTVIRAYNDVATRGHKLTQVFSYATDMEMYCPESDPALCRPQDLQT